MEYVIVKTRHGERRGRVVGHFLSARQAREEMVDIALWEGYHRGGEGREVRNGRPYDTANKCYLYTNAQWTLFTEDVYTWECIPEREWRKER